MKPGATKLVEDDAPRRNVDHLGELAKKIYRVDKKAIIKRHYDKYTHMSSFEVQQQILRWGELCEEEQARVVEFKKTGKRTKKNPEYNTFVKLLRNGANLWAFERLYQRKKLALEASEAQAQAQAQQAAAHAAARALARP